MGFPLNRVSLKNVLYLELIEKWCTVEAELLLVFLFAAPIVAVVP
jgi:hypothetical protein